MATSSVSDGRKSTTVSKERALLLMSPPSNMEVGVSNEEYNAEVGEWKWHSLRIKEIVLDPFWNPITKTISDEPPLVWDEKTKSWVSSLRRLSSVDDLHSLPFTVRVVVSIADEDSIPEGVFLGVRFPGAANAGGWTQRLKHWSVRRRIYSYSHDFTKAINFHADGLICEC